MSWEHVGMSLCSSTAGYRLLASTWHAFLIGYRYLDTDTQYLFRIHLLNLLSSHSTFACKACGLKTMTVCHPGPFRLTDAQIQLRYPGKDTKQNIPRQSSLNNVKSCYNLWAHHASWHYIWTRVMAGMRNMYFCILFYHCKKRKREKTNETCWKKICESSKMYFYSHWL